VSHAAIIENKRLGEVLAWIKQQQDKIPMAFASTKKRFFSSTVTTRST